MSEETKTLRELLSAWTARVDAPMTLCHLLTALVNARDSLTARVAALETRKSGDTAPILHCSRCGVVASPGDPIYYDPRGGCQDWLCSACARMPTGNDSAPPATNPAPAQATAGNEAETRGRCADCGHLRNRDLGDEPPFNGLCNATERVIPRFADDVCGIGQWTPRKKEAG